MKRIIEMTFNNREEGFILPINPQTLEISEANKNTKIDLLNVGEINLIGNRGLKVITLSSFFPNVNSHFNKEGREPIEYKNMLEKWKNSKKPIRLIISDMGLNLAAAIENLTFSMREGDGDIYYTIELAEYRFLNVPNVAESKEVKDNGLKDRPKEKVKPNTYTVKSGDTMWAIAKKQYGDGGKYTELYSKNKSLIDSKNKNKVDKYTIYAGQVLTL